MSGYTINNREYSIVKRIPTDHELLQWRFDRLKYLRSNIDLSSSVYRTVKGQLRKDQRSGYNFMCNHDASYATDYETYKTTEHSYCVEKISIQFNETIKLGIIDIELN